jgi:hypothetical protein
MTEAPWQDAVNNIEAELDRLRMLKDWAEACRYVWHNPEMAEYVEHFVNTSSRNEQAAMSAWRMGGGKTALYRVAHDFGMTIIKESSRQEVNATRLLTRLARAHWEPPTEVAVEVGEPPPKRRAVKKR